MHPGGPALPSRSCTVDLGCHAPPALSGILRLGCLVLPSAARNEAAPRACLRCRSRRTAAADGFRATAGKHFCTAPAGTSTAGFGRPSAPLPPSLPRPSNCLQVPRAPPALTARLPPARAPAAPPGRGPRPAEPAPRSPRRSRTPTTSSTGLHRHAQRPRSAGRCRQRRAVASPPAAARRPRSPPPAGAAALGHSTAPRRPCCCRVFGPGLRSQRLQLIGVDAVVAAEKGRGAIRAAVAGGHAEDLTASSVVRSRRGGLHAAPPAPELRPFVGLT